MSKALEGLNIDDHVAGPSLAPNRDTPETDFPDTGFACCMVVVGWWQECLLLCESHLLSRFSNVRSFAVWPSLLQPC
jgi:hypothetical protein